MGLGASGVAVVVCLGVWACGGEWCVRCERSCELRVTRAPTDSDREVSGWMDLGGVAVKEPDKRVLLVWCLGRPSQRAKNLHQHSIPPANAWPSHDVQHFWGTWVVGFCGPPAVRKGERGDEGEGLRGKADGSGVDGRLAHTVAAGQRSAEYGRPLFLRGCSTPLGSGRCLFSAGHGVAGVVFFSLVFANGDKPRKLEWFRRWVVARQDITETETNLVLGPSLIHMTLTAADSRHGTGAGDLALSKPWRSGAQGVVLVHPSIRSGSSNNKQQLINYNSTTTATTALLHSTGDHLHRTRTQHISVLHSSLHSTSLHAPVHSQPRSHTPCGSRAVYARGNLPGD